jgi:hypothetical protein
MHRRRRKGGAKRLGELVVGVYPSREPEEVRALRAFSWWERAVPPRVSKNARPVRFSRGVLTVHAATSAWAQELDFLKESLLGSVKKHAPEANVRRIHIRVGPLPELPPRPRERTRSVPPKPVSELPEELARALATVAHDELRKVISSAAAVSLGDEPDSERDSEVTGVRRRR